MNAWALVALMVRMNVACNLLLIALLLAAVQPLTPPAVGVVLLVISGLLALWGSKLAVASIGSLRRGA